MTVNVKPCKPVSPCRPPLPTVSYNDAMSADVRTLSDLSIDACRNVLGATKLDIRRAARFPDCSDVLALLKPISRRIDELNFEELDRQAVNGRPKGKK